MNIVDDDISLSLSLSLFLFSFILEVLHFGGKFDSETLAPKFWEF